MYFNITPENAKYNKITGTWTIDLPEEFCNSNNIHKSITVLNLIYYSTTKPYTNDFAGNFVFTSLHSPTLCDGNLSQNDYYITCLTKNYTYTVTHKNYPIKSRIRELEFWFKYDDGTRIINYSYEYDPVNYPGTLVEEKFIIELELNF